MQRGHGHRLAVGANAVLVDGVGLQQAGGRGGTRGVWPPLLPSRPRSRGATLSAAPAMPKGSLLIGH